MSQDYANPLDRFRSYSYHYVMTASASTESFRQLINNNGQRLFQDAANAKIGEQLNVNGQKAWLVFDTRRFSQYSVMSVEMSHAIGAGSTTANPATPISMISMNMIDTTGLSFYGFLMDLMRNKMKTRRASAFFMLAIVFVGHRDDGTTETVSTCFIPMVLLTMGFDFTVDGSHMNLQFAEFDNSPAVGSMKDLDNLGDVASITTKENGRQTIGELLDALENRLNIQSLAFWQKYNNTDLPDSKGRLVQYMITVPNSSEYPWRDMVADTAQKSNYGETRFLTTSASKKNGGAQTVGGSVEKTSTKKSTYAQMTFSKATDIGAAIKQILESSTQFNKQASEKANTDNGSVTLYKIVKSVTSDDLTYIVHYDVYPYTVAKPDKSTADIKSGKTKQEAGKTDKGNIIEYDYLFTGKNSNIKDIKISFHPSATMALDTVSDIGANRHAAVAAAGQRRKQVGAAGVPVTKVMADDVQILDNEPVFPGGHTRLRNTNAAGMYLENKSRAESRAAIQARQEMYKFYAMYHFVTAISMDLEVRGNPNLIRKFADKNVRGGIAPHPKIIIASSVSKLKVGSASDVYSQYLQKNLQSAKQQYITEYVEKRAKNKIVTDGDSLVDGPDVLVKPIFVKINIRAPDVNWDGTPVDAKQPYTDKFFYNEYYLMLTNHTYLQNGEFYHVMHLASASAEMAGVSKKSGVN